MNLSLHTRYHTHPANPASVAAGYVWVQCPRENIDAGRCPERKRVSVEQFEEAGPYHKWYCNAHFRCNALVGGEW